MRNTLQEPSTTETPAPATTRLVGRNTMPYEVATEMLLSSGPMTNRARKTYQDARSKVYESTATKREVTDFIASRMNRAKWTQLVKWLRRASARYSGAQDAHRDAVEYLDKLRAEDCGDDKQKTAVFAWRIIKMERALAAIALKAAQLQIFLDAVENEIDRRTKLVKNLKAIGAPRTAKKLLAAIEAN